MRVFLLLLPVVLCMRLTAVDVDEQALHERYTVVDVDEEASLHETGELQTIDGEKQLQLAEAETETGLAFLTIIGILTLAKIFVPVTIVAALQCESCVGGSSSSYSSNARRDQDANKFGPGIASGVHEYPDIPDLKSGKIKINSVRVGVGCNSCQRLDAACATKVAAERQANAAASATQFGIMRMSCNGRTKCDITLRDTVLYDNCDDKISIWFKCGEIFAEQINMTHYHGKQITVQC